MQAKLLEISDKNIDKNANFEEKNANLQNDLLKVVGEYDLYKDECKKQQRTTKLELRSLRKEWKRQKSICSKKLNTAIRLRKETLTENEEDISEKEDQIQEFKEDRERAREETDVARQETEQCMGKLRGVKR